MPELIATLDAYRKRTQEDREFQAQLHNAQMGDSPEQSNPWEDMKARVFSGGKAKSSNDVLALSGVTAQQKGFGIGHGLSYASSDDVEWWKQ
jgi:hypothetical protein